jgi:SAM-dependent methyltransferase
MKRVPEPELMTEAAQVRAYAEADFSEPNARFITLVRERCPTLPVRGMAADLGCGPGDIAIRFAGAFPDWVVDGIDGSEAMLDAGRVAVEAARLASRIRLHQLLLPAPPPARGGYDLVLSNSLLHHLPSPATLWSTVRWWMREGGSAFVMDLMRPASLAEVRALVRAHAASEPPVLQRDFYNSLLAAYRPDEVREQLVRAGLDGFCVETVSDRHLVVFGRLGRP